MELHDIKKPKVYGAQEVADFMQISYMTLYRLVKSGKIKATNIAPSGSKKAIYVFTPEDIQAYYDSIPHTTRVQAEENKNRGNAEPKSIDK